MYLYTSLALSEWVCGNTLLCDVIEPDSVGMDRTALADAVSIIRDSVDSNEIPGAVILVARRGKVVYIKRLDIEISMNRLDCRRTLCLGWRPTVKR